jgi:hypothetical protein
MANTFTNGGIFIDQIAEQSLDYLSTQFHPLRAFARDFSTDISGAGESVSTRVPSSMTVSDLSTGYTATDVTSTGITINLNKFKGYSMAFTDLEVSKAGNFDWLSSIFLAPALEVTLDAVMDDLLALVLNANFSANEVITAANFDLDEVADLASDLTVAKCPKSERALVLPSSYYASLAKDNLVQDASAYGNAGPIKDNIVQKAHGFSIYEYTGIPTNSENLAAIALHPSALCLAARQPAAPSDGSVSVADITDPSTGLPIQLRTWYDNTAGKHYLSMGVLYGVAVGNGAALKRIKSA